MHGIGELSPAESVRIVDPRIPKDSWWDLASVTVDADRRFSSELSRWAKPLLDPLERRFVDPVTRPHPTLPAELRRSARPYLVTLYRPRLLDLERSSVYRPLYSIVPTARAAQLIRDPMLADAVRRFWLPTELDLGHNARAKFAPAVREMLEGDWDGSCPTPWCDARGLRTRFEIDHKIPVALGGDDEPANLHLICSSCNASKGASTWKAFVARGSRRRVA